MHFITYLSFVPNQKSRSDENFCIFTPKSAPKTLKSKVFCVASEKISEKIESLQFFSRFKRNFPVETRKY